MHSQINRFLRCVAVLMLIWGADTLHADEPVWSAPAALTSNATTDAAHDVDPKVSTDGNGTWVAVWRSTDTLGNTIGTDEDILYSRSTDEGATWGSPAALNTNAATDTGQDYEPNVSADGGGTWVAAWESTDTLGGMIGTDSDILYSRSTDGGATWSAPAALNTNANMDTGDDYAINVSTDGNGTWVATWESTDTLGETIGTDSDILYSRSTDGGSSWSAPTALNTNAVADTGSDYTPNVSTDRNGTWVTVWCSNDSLGGMIGTDSDVLFSRSTDGGATWSAPAALNTNAAADTGNDYIPNLSTDGNGSWVSVWESNDSLVNTIGTDYDILVSRSTNGGATWSAPVALNANAAADTRDDGFPSVSTDRNGTWMAVWYSNDSLGNTIGMDYDILFSRSTDGGATWSASAALNTNAATDTGGDYAPSVSTDGNGTWVAVWNSEDSLGGSIGSDFDILFSTTFIKLPGSLRVKIAPAAARGAGAQWRVELEPGMWSDWMNHRETVTGLEPGQHTVEFKGLTGWDGPATTTVSIVAGALRKRTGTYCQHGALVVTLKPQGARDAGARWRVSTGPSTWTKWKKSATMVSGLSSGEHVVQCNSVPGFTTPGNRKVTVSPASGSTAIRKYK